MKHAFVMDPLAAVKPWKDTTYFLMLAARQRGHQVCHLEPHALRLEHNRAHARVSWLEVNEDPARPFNLLEQTDCALSEMDAVWIRANPPFDRRYFYTTLLLDNLPATTRVLNRPSGIRNWNEKLAALHYPELTPPTRVTNNSDDLKQFSQTHGRITIKPIDGFGGKGIIFYDAGDDNGSTNGSDNPLTTATHNNQRWVIAQQYLPAAREGDKRILLLNGAPLGAILRIHAKDAELNNLDAGATPHPAELTPQDHQTCQTLKPGLLQQGIFLAGIDIIGNMLIEINVTSPTGLQELCQFNDEDYNHQIIEALE